MANIQPILAGWTLPELEMPFLQKPMENATDIVTLAGNIYTDFVNQRQEWELNFNKLEEADYNTLYGIYASQFSTATYPVFELPYYGINTPVRMYINDKDIQKDGCWIRNVKITLVQRAGFNPTVVS